MAVDPHNAGGNVNLSRVFKGIGGILEMGLDIVYTFIVGF